MQRYKLLSKIITDRTTQRKRVSTTHYPKLPLKNSDIYTYSKGTDRLDLLAYKYYGDQTYWWVIADANNLGKGTLQVPPGIRLRIPYPVDYNILNNLID